MKAFVSSYLRGLGVVFPHVLMAEVNWSYLIEFPIIIMAWFLFFWIDDKAFPSKGE